MIYKKEIKNKFRKVAYVVFILVFTISCSCMCVYADNTDMSYDNGRIILIGDVNASNYVKNNGADDIDLYNFKTASITDETSIGIFINAINNNADRYVLFSMRDDNFAAGTKASEFENYLRLYIAECKKRNKIIFFHTYNDAIVNLSNEYDNAYYIDMTEFNTGEYKLSDGVNYKKIYFTTLKSKLYKAIDKIRHSDANYRNLWELIEDDKKINITGDSYAGVFIESEKDNGIYELTAFAKSEQTIQQNEKLTKSSLSTEAKYVVLSIGPNDYFNQTSLYDFKNKLREFANLASDHSKKLYFHTYMDIGIDYQKTIKIKEYDNCLREIAMLYDCVEYIDMSDCEKGIYLREDKIHYNKYYFDELLKRIINTI